MQITPLVKSVRAVSAEFARRILFPIAIIVGCALVILVGISSWLVTLSGWWWFLLGPLLLITVLALFASVIAGLLIHFLEPRQSSSQRKHVKRFVGSLQYASDTIQTPKFILLSRLIIDLLNPSKKGIVGELSENATSLHKEFKAIIKEFSE